MFFLDSTTLIYFFKGEGNVAERLLSEPPYNIALPVIVLYELKVGILKSASPRRRMQQLEELRRHVNIFGVGEKEAEAAAEIRAELEMAGERIGPCDVLIAGITRANGGTLVTRNLREFQKVPNLQVTDWYA